MMQKLVEIANAALDASGEVIRPYFRTGLGVEDKSDESPVTAADRKAEQVLRAALTQATPDFGIIGEEFPAHNKNAKYVWVIDPIDGTRAFITGRPSFATLLGLLEDGQPVLGFIDQPILCERWLGGRGVRASFQSRYGGEPGTRAEVKLAEAELSCTSPEMIESAGAEVVRRFNRLKQVVKRIYWGGDAYAFGLLALGQIDVVAERELKPWDWAALAPVVEAAGGVITDWAGEKLKLGCDGSVLASANPALHEAALAALRA